MDHLHANRVLYLGPIDPAGTCYSRLRAMERLGVDVRALDKNAVINSCLSLFERKLLSRFGLCIRSGVIARRLLEELKTSQCNIVWLDRADWLCLRTLRALKAKGYVLYQHTTDSLFSTRSDISMSRRLLRESVGIYDRFLTTNRRDIAKLRSRGFRNIMKTEMGFDDERFLPDVNDRSTSSRNVAGAVKFIGHFEPRSLGFVQALARAGVKLHVFGDDWVSKLKSTKEISVAGSLWGVDYENAIKSSIVCLGFLSEWNYNEITVRSLEVPASGRLLIAPRTREHTRALKEGLEAEFFESKDELISKVRYYSSHRDEADRIGFAGSRRVYNGGRWIDVMRNDLQMLGLLRGS